MTPEQIKKTIEELLTHLGVGFEEVSHEEVQNRSAFVVKTPESHLLIGSRGAHIAALNHLVKRVVAKQLATAEGGEHEKLDFYVDVNDYHSRLVQEIQNKANILAGRARSFKTNIEMDPMSSYERMIVHNLFQDVPDITTESSGNGPKRHVVLKYVEISDEPRI